MSYDPMAFLSKLSALCNIICKILFCIKTLEFSENVGLFYGFFQKNPAKIEVLTRKFQGLSMIQETAKIKNANFKGAKIGGLVYKQDSNWHEKNFIHLNLIRNYKWLIC